MAGYIGSKAAVVSSGAERKKTFDITGTTTSLTGLSYTPTFVHLFHNGVRLVDGTDYTATNGTSITLTTAAQSGDQVVVVSYATFQAADAYTKAEADDEFVSKDGDTITTAAGTALTLDRTGSDGTILDLKKNGSTVGSIGTIGGDTLTVGSGDTGLLMNQTNDEIIPWNVSSNAARDNAIDLGDASHRFKDLYLSGGVYLGGTGSANKLDDYEEGTWTPTAASGCTGFTIRRASYTKIGRLVYLQAYLSGITGKDGNPAKIGGMPFTPATNVYSGGFMDTASDGDVGFIRTNSSSATLSIYSWDSSSIHRNDMLGTEVGSQFIFSVLYETDA